MKSNETENRLQRVEQDLLAHMESARRFQPHLYAAGRDEIASDDVAHVALNAATIGQIARPELRLLDLPQPALQFHENATDAPLVALFAAPWPQAVELDSGAAQPSFATAPSVMGETRNALAKGPIGRWSRGIYLDIALYGGSLAALPPQVYWIAEAIALTPVGGAFTAGRVAVAIHYMRLPLPARA